MSDRKGLADETLAIIARLKADLADIRRDVGALHDERDAWKARALTAEAALRQEPSVEERLKVECEHCHRMTTVPAESHPRHV